MMKGEQSKPPIEIISSIKSEEEEDQISSLPDCLLVEILSCLPETKYAIRTGALSKRWQHLWPQLPNLILFYYSEELGDSEYNVSQFYSSVERIISQCGQSNLSKFKLHAEYTKNTKYQVRNCIRNAINHNVQEVDFRVIKYPCHCYDEWFALPEFFFISSSFIHLTLSLCMFKKAYVVSWENLRTLRIEDTEIDHDSIKSILSGSPLLETLMLYHCYGFKQLDITNKSVKNLVFSGYDNALCIYAVAINAPYILSLTIQDRLLLKKLLLLNMSSVIKAELDYCADLEGEGEEDEVNEEMLKGLLLSLGHVKEVKIGDYCLEALARLKAKGFIYPSNLKVLQEIDSNSSRDREELLINHGPNVEEMS